MSVVWSTCRCTGAAGWPVDGPRAVARMPRAVPVATRPDPVTQAVLAVVASPERRVAQPVVGDVDALRLLEAPGTRDIGVVPPQERPPGDLDRLGARVGRDAEPRIEVIGGQGRLGHGPHPSVPGTRAARYAPSLAGRTRAARPAGGWDRELHQAGAGRGQGRGRAGPDRRRPGEGQGRRSGRRGQPEGRRPGHPGAPRQERAGGDGDGPARGLDRRRADRPGDPRRGHHQGHGAPGDDQRLAAPRRARPTGSPRSRSRRRSRPASRFSIGRIDDPERDVDRPRRSRPRTLVEEHGRRRGRVIALDGTVVWTAKASTRSARRSAAELPDGARRTVRARSARPAVSQASTSSIGRIERSPVARSVTSTPPAASERGLTVRIQGMPSSSASVNLTPGRLVAVVVQDLARRPAAGQRRGGARRPRRPAAPWSAPIDTRWAG